MPLVPKFHHVSGTVKALSALATIIPTFLLFAPAGVAASLEQAMKDYQDKKYSVALSSLNELSKQTAQKQDKVHYYKALCYQAQNQMALAKQEYFEVYKTSTDERLKANAYYAMKGLEKWSAHRAYNGQGNNFSRSTLSSTSASASGSSAGPASTSSTDARADAGAKAKARAKAKEEWDEMVQAAEQQRAAKNATHRGCH